MSDAALSALFGSARIQSVTTGSTAQNTGNVPPEIANLSTGSLIKGFVINRDRDNNPILRTPQGDVLVKSNVFLKTGSEVVIRVEHQSNQNRARIMSVNGESIQQIQQRQERDAQTNAQDRVLQSSMMTGKPVEDKILDKTQLLAEQKIMRDMIRLEAMLLKPAASSSNPAMQHTMASILKLPPAAMYLLEKGAALEFRVIASELSGKAPPLTPQATVARPAMVTTPLPAAPNAPTINATLPAAATPPPVASKLGQPTQMLYQLYNKLSGTPAPLVAKPTTAPASAPPATITAPQTTAAPASATATITTNPVQPQTSVAHTIAQQMHQAASSTATLMGGATTSTPAPTPSLAPALSAGMPFTAPNASATPTPAATMPAGSAPSSITTPAAPFTQPLASQPINTSPAQPAAAPQISAAAPGTITARVIGIEPSGETIVRTPIGTVKLFTASPPPLHSVLQLQLVIPNTPAGQANLPPPSPVSQAMVTFSTLAHDWAALDEAYQLLAQADPAIAREFSNRVPNTKSSLVNGVLFFMSALSAGNARNWLGARATATLEEKSPALLNRLMGDFSGIRAVLRDQPDQPWQMLPFPLMHEDELHQARLFLRQDESDSKSKEKAGTRFLVELSMTEMGEIQLDGLVRKAGGQTLFDLVLRSEHPLPDTMQNDIMQLFTSAAEATGYTGSLRFQPDPARFIMPLAETRYNGGHDDNHSIIA